MKFEFFSRKLSKKQTKSEEVSESESSSHMDTERNAEGQVKQEEEYSAGLVKSINMTEFEVSGQDTCERNLCFDGHLSQKLLGLEN